MRTIEEIEALMLAMGEEMFYVENNSLWWAKVVKRNHFHDMNNYTETTPLYTLKTDIDNPYAGVYETKQEALNKALDKHINEGETK